MRRVLVLVAAVIFATAPVLSADDWPSFGGTPGGTRASAETLVLPVSDSAGGGWTVAFAGAEIVASPVVAGDLVYVCLTSGDVHALRVSDGTTAWTVNVADHPHNAVNATPAVYGGRLYVATMERRLLVLDAATGATVWTASLGGNSMSSPVAADGVIYVGSGFPETTLQAFDATTGAPLWSADTGAFVYGAPAVANGRVYVGDNKGVYRAYTAGPSGGTLVGSFAVGGSSEISAPAVTPAAVFLTVARQSKRFAAVTPDLSSVLWSAQFENPAAPPPWSNPTSSSPSVSGTSLLFAAGQRPGSGLTLFARDASTGGSLWNIALGNTLEQLGITPSPLSTPTQVVCVTQSSAQLRVLDLATGADLAGSPYALAGPCAASPVFANGRVFVCTWNGTVHCFNSPNAPPPAPASGFAPAGGAILNVDSATLIWDAVVDPNGDVPVSYIVRYDTDGDLIDYTEAAATTATSLAIGPLPDNVTVVWAVRARDLYGAASTFSATQTFVVRLPPDPPAAFSVTPANGAATLTWAASPSADVDHYEAAVRLSGGGAFGAWVNVGAGVTYSWPGLTNSIAYDFTIRAVDATALPSTTLEASVMPAPPVTLVSAGGGSTSYASLAAALAAAGAGDTVELEAEEYGILSTLSLPEGVTLVGAGVRLTRIEGHLSADGAVVQVDSTSGWTAYVRDLTLSNPGSSADRPGLLADGGVVSLRNVLILDTTTGIRGENGADVEVINVTIASPTEFGIDLLDTQSSIRNTLVTGAGLIGMRADPLSSPSTSLGYSNVVGSGVSNYDGLSPDANSFSTAVTYVDSASGDYREVVGSPTVDTGDPADPFDQEPYHNGGRVNIGAFGNTPDATVNSLPATPTAGFSPTGGVVLGVDSATLAWDGVVDPDPADVTISYVIRYDTDGDLVDYVELPGTTATSVGLTGLPDNASVVWAVQAVDPKGAPSSFSATQSFVIRIPPAPVASFTVTPANGAATLTWGASPSADVDHYEAAVRLSGSGAFGAWVNVGAGATYSWPGLTNSTAYDFTIQAVDGTALSSTTVEASVMPAPPVALVVAGGGSTSYASLAAALAAAVAGDTVQLGANDYGVISTLSLPEGVTLAGAGVRLTRIEGHLSADGALVRVSSTSGQTARIRDLTLRNPGSSADRPGVLADGGVVALQNVLLLDTTTGIRAQSGANVQMANITIVSPTEFGIDLFGSQSSIRNALIAGAGQNGIRADAPAALLATLGYNDVVGSVVSDYGGLSPDANSISAAVTYVDTLSGDYREVPGSPTVDVGDPAAPYSLEPYYNGGRINIGAFGNTADATTSPPPPGADPDGDGILTVDELILGADPGLVDTDADGQSDVAEIGADPSAATDTDADGVPDVIEPAAYEGDASIMGFTLSDSEASAIGITGLAGTTIVVSAPGAALARVPTVGFATPLENTVSEGGAPSGYTMPFGLLRFNVAAAPGATVAVTVTYASGVSIPGNAIYMKYAGTWASFGGAAGLGDGDSGYTLTLTDGGVGDADGLANGLIVDPGGIAVPIPVASAGSSSSGGTSGASASGGATAAPAGGDSGGGSSGGCFARNLAGGWSAWGIMIFLAAGVALSLRRVRQGPGAAGSRPRWENR